jgi:hypothetical protein
MRDFAKKNTKEARKKETLGCGVFFCKFDNTRQTLQRSPGRSEKNTKKYQEFSEFLEARKRCWEIFQGQQRYH